MRRSRSFFKQRKHLRTPPAELKLDAELAADVDEARALMFELGDELGYSKRECEIILKMLANPIAGLKFMIALARETRKLHGLSERGLLKLPSPPRGTESSR